MKHPPAFLWAFEEELPAVRIGRNRMRKVSERETEAEKFQKQNEKQKQNESVRGYEVN